MLSPLLCAVEEDVASRLLRNYSACLVYHLAHVTAVVGGNDCGAAFLQLVAEQVHFIGFAETDVCIVDGGDIGETLAQDGLQFGGQTADVAEIYLGIASDGVNWLHAG